MSNSKVIFLFLTLLITNINTVNADTRAKKVFAHYLPWYDAAGIQAGARTGWCYEGDCTDLTNIHYSNEPRIGEYTQFDEDVVEYHLLTMFVTGIDGLIINVNPQYALQKNITYEVLDKINELKTNYANFDMSIILSYDNGDATQSVIEDYFTWMHDSIYHNPIYEDLIFNDDLTGKEVLQAWSESDNAYYHQITQTLWGAGNVLLMVRNAVRFDDSEGNFHWIGNLTNDPTNTTTWGQNYFNDFDWIMARQEDFGLVDPMSVNTVKMGAVYPGFNDENVPDFWAGGTPRYIQRNVDDGITLELTWGMQQTYTPLRLGGVNSVENPWVQIVTWNDWPEGTSIEPATDATYGYTPLIICQTEISTWKGTSNGYTAACLEVPYEIYLARKAGNNTDADTACDLLMAGDCTAAFAVLPVELNQFSARLEQDFVWLEWETMNEQNNKGFDIERKTENEAFRSIAWLPAKSEEQNYYDLKDYEIEEGMTYQYRLKQVDLNGDFVYSEIKTVRISQQNSSIIIYPNPVREAIIIEQENAAVKSSTLRIYSPRGKLFLEKSINLSKTEISLHSLAPGIYFLEIYDDRGVRGCVQKIVKE